MSDRKSSEEKGGDSEIVVDWKKALVDVGDDRDFLLECLKDFLGEAQEGEGELDKAIKNKDYPGIKAAAHKVKGAAAYLSCKALESISTDIDHAAYERVSLENIEKMFEIFKDRIKDLDEEVDRKGHK